jgi:hypothetical protein
VELDGAPPEFALPVPAVETPLPPADAAEFPPVAADSPSGCSSEPEQVRVSLQFEFEQAASPVAQNTVKMPPATGRTQAPKRAFCQENTS